MEFSREDIGWLTIPFSGGSLPDQGLDLGLPRESRFISKIITLIIITKYEVCTTQPHPTQEEKVSNLLSTVSRTSKQRNLDPNLGINTKVYVPNYKKCPRATQKAT